jgi:uncharacterized protein (DUF1501 family)
MIISRRKFLRTGGSVVAVSAAPAMLWNVAAARAAENNRSTAGRALVVVELNGGNDALNTVIPIANPLYAVNRPTLAVGRREALMLEKGVGLHPAMAGLRDLYVKGQLAIVQGVGYPNPSRSHFRSMEIWHRGHLGDVATGWLGQSTRAAVHYGAGGAELFKAEGMVVREMPEVEETGAGTVGYCRGRLGAGLAEFAKRIVKGSEAKLFYVSQGGFDTHARQAESHGELLGAVSASISGFLAELRAHGREREVMVLVFSEFGRRLRENSSAGTDHGTAGVMFLAGGGVAGGLYGRCPGLGDLSDGDVKHTVDFRDCYATVLENWLGTSADRVLAGRFGRMEFVA